MKGAREGGMSWSLTLGEARAERMATNSLNRLSLNEGCRNTFVFQAAIVLGFIGCA